MEETDIEQLKTNLQSYLETNGIRTDKFFRCINPDHYDEHPSMRFFEDHKVYCFGCGVTYDLIGAIAAIEGLDRSTAFKKAIDYYGVNKATIIPQYKKQDIKQENEEAKNYSKAFYFWHKNLANNEKALEYLKSRGIDAFIAEKYNLGFNKFQFGDKNLEAIIIPINKNCFTARNIDKTSEFRHYKPKNVHTEIFNSKALINTNPFCVITEGEFDCLSFEQVGINAISLGSVSNVNKFIKAPKNPKTFVLALDNDEAGKLASDELKAYFKENKVPYIEFDNCGYKDANEALVNDKENFKKGIERVIEREIRRMKKLNQEM